MLNNVNKVNVKPTFSVVFARFVLPKLSGWAVLLGIMALLLPPKGKAALSCCPCQLEEIGFAGLVDRGGNSGGLEAERADVTIFLPLFVKLTSSLDSLVHSLPEFPD